MGNRRKDIVLATKMPGPRGAGPNDTGLFRRHILQSVEESLTRVGTDYIDLYQIHGFDLLDVMREMARDKHASVAQVALSWLLHQPVVTSVIIGAKTPEQLAENHAEVDVTLTDDELARRKAVSELPAEYPGWMLDRQIAAQSKAVEKEGGFTERMYLVRTSRRKS